MKQLLPKKLTPERIAECEQFIQTSLEMTMDEYLEFYHRNKGYCGQIIIDYFTLPKTETHEKRLLQIGKPHKAMRRKKDEERLQKILIENVKKAQTEHIKFKDTESDRKYKIINKIDTEQGMVLTIGIPYQILEPGRGYQTKYAYTMNIEERTHPELYKKFLDNMTEYKGEQ